MPKNDPPLTEAERKSAVFCERLVCVDADENNAKFWEGFVLADGTYLARYGRISDDGGCQTIRKPLGEHAARKKVEAETRKRLNYKSPKAPYTRQRTVADTSAASRGRGKAVSSGDVRATALAEIDFGGNKHVRDLLAWSADVNIHTITAHTNITYNQTTGVFSTPLGVVEQSGIDDARVLLGTIGNYVRDLESAAAKKAINEYLMIIPQDVGRKRGWHLDMFSQHDSLQKQNDLLDSLAASIQQVMTAPKGKIAAKAKRVFDVKLEILEDKKKFDAIRRKFRSERGSHYDVRDLDLNTVFVVDIATVASAFQRDGKKIGNIMQLWHGTKASNLLSILKGGLIVPPVSSSHVTGRMYGPGIYASSQSTKALRYATNAWGYGGNTDRTFMFLVDMSMGKPYVPSGTRSSTPPSGYDSYWAKPHESGVMNHEMIVPRASQVNLVFLCEFTPRGR